MEKGITLKEEPENRKEVDNLNHVSSNLNASDIDEETNVKLRGDAIGDTLYSQSFVLKTLLQFSDLQWSEEVEEDLCFLWDMTVEKDVCQYLFEISYPSLACTALLKYTENRFVEIVIGILANILCVDCRKTITVEEISIVLKELDTDDHLILLQLARFISAIAYMFKELPFITMEVLNKIEFILYNSTNDELLLKTLEAVAKLSTNYKLDRGLINIRIINSSLTAYRSIIGTDEFELDSTDRRLSCRYMLEIVSNICAYIDKFDDKDLLCQFRNCLNIFINEAVKILDYFSHDENLLPVTDEFVFYMSVFRFVLEILNVGYLSELFLPLSNILYKIFEFKDEVTELFESCIELECFLFFRSNPKYVYQDLKRMPKSRVKRILYIVNENKHKFDFNLDLQHLIDRFK